MLSQPLFKKEFSPTKSQKVKRQIKDTKGDWMNTLCAFCFGNLAQGLPTDLLDLPTRGAPYWPVGITEAPGAISPHLSPPFCCQVLVHATSASGITSSRKRNNTWETTHLSYCATFWNYKRKVSNSQPAES